MGAQTKFRVEWIAIEGFKGFTARQEVRLDGKHLFILGPNGHGKSSIVEAIRWGLFGSTRRPNEVISNQAYAGSCRVELGLERSGERLRLRRTLIRGASGGSDAEITDSKGNEHPIREVLPHLESVGAGEGMHIVYAAQSTPMRRGPEDLRPFERTIYAYLGIIELPELISLLDDFEADQEDQENQLGNELTEKRLAIEASVVDLESRRDHLLQNPPWDETLVPDIAATTQRIQAFLVDLGGASHVVGDLRGLLELADEALASARSRQLADLERRDWLGCREARAG